MPFNRSDGASEFAVLHPRSVEVFDIADLISENNTGTVPIKTAIDKRLVRFSLLGTR